MGGIRLRTCTVVVKVRQCRVCTVLGVNSVECGMCTVCIPGRGGGEYSVQSV